MQKKNVAVLLGGSSNERHVSVESGRNVYEKLSCSELYNPIPIFVIVQSGKIRLFNLPLNFLYKDNADDIKSSLLKKIENHDVINSIILDAEFIRSKYGGKIIDVKELSFEDLVKTVGFVFIALHGHPGEDGVIQSILDSLKLPYNGSSAISSKLTMNKFLTNKLLHEQGILVPKNVFVSIDDFKKNYKLILNKISSCLEPSYILKPVNDGCSAGVKKFKDLKSLECYLMNLAFSNFVEHNEFLVEECVESKCLEKVLEISCGFFTTFEQGKVKYNVFSPSETIRSGDILSLEEKFLLGEGRNITPIVFCINKDESNRIESQVKSYIEKTVKILGTYGYGRVDAFVKIFENGSIEIIILEINSLPAMTSSTCIFHQCVLFGFSPLDFIHTIISSGLAKHHLINKL